MNAIAQAHVAGTMAAIEKFAANALMRHLAAGGNAAAQAVNRGAANPAQIASMQQRKQQLMAQHGVTPNAVPQTNVHQKPGGAAPQAPGGAQPVAQPGFMSQLAQQAVPTAMMIGAPYLIDKVMGGSKAPQEEPVY
jgi:hypothetical protein